MERVEPRPLTVAPAWIERHCVVPDGFRKGDPFRLYGYQLRYLGAFYLVRGDARWDPEDPVLAPAFVYRRGLLVGPQKLGKGPHTAAHICLEGVGPALFAGWAGRDDGYACADHGCPCRWEFGYELGEPMGMLWPTPLIQITAVSEEQPLALDTPVPTPTGWSTVGALRVGDHVLDHAGQSALVTRETETVQGLDCYAVTFSDGERIVASASHGWTLQRRTTHGDHHEAVTVTTRKLAETYQTSRGGKRYRTATGVPWNLPAASLPVDPYLLGLWLGDGSTADATIAYDTRLRDELEAILKPLLAEHEEAVWRVGPGNQGTVRFRRRAGVCPWGHEYGEDVIHRSCGPCRRGEVRPGRRDSLRERLRGAGVLGRKHIPVTYLRASAEQRWALLQGLIDSDGHVETSGRAGFTNTDPLLVDGVTELLTTLGLTWNKRYDTAVQAWRVFFVPTAEQPVARLAHKRSRHRPSARRRGSAWRYVQSVEPVGSVPVRCVGIDTSEHLFLVGRRAVPTHNTDNIYDALRPMIEEGRLSDLIRRTGEDFIRLPGGGRIDTVTSSAQSRLGQRITFAPQDELGLWTPTNKMTKVADIQYRGLAGMGGRASLTTNPWDPAENSVAQQQYESSATDVYRQFTQAPKGLSYRNKQERRKIHRVVYEDALRDRGGHIDLDGIEAEAADLLERDPGQAERFFGNRIVRGIGAWLPDGLWPMLPEWLPPAPDGAAVSAAFDGSENSDLSVIRCETVEGYLFTPRYGPDRRPTIWNPAEWGGRIPRDQVDIAWAEIDDRYRLERAYCDPGFHDETSWESEIEAWAVRFGSERVVQWPTNQLGRMYSALVRFVSDLKTGAITHDGCPVTGVHMGNARKIAKTADRYVLGKPSPAQKIDAAVTSVIAHEAAADARAEGWSAAPPDRRVIVYR